MINNYIRKTNNTDLKYKPRIVKIYLEISVVHFSNLYNFNEKHLRKKNLKI